MCGIFGFSLPLDTLSPEERAVLGALLASGNDNRGGDSWGAYVLNGEMKIVRGLGKATTGAPWPSLLGQARVLMGHTRKATVGAATVENAHPFEIGNVVGAHNGHISNHTEMNTKYNRNFQVDSMHIFAHIQKGWKISELHGWGAIEYTNKKKWPERVNMAKVSSTGDLCIAGLGKGPEDANGIVWSSNEGHLLTALRAAGLEGRFFLYKVDPFRIYWAEAGKLGIFSGKRHELGFATYTSSWGDSEFCGNGASQSYWPSVKDDSRRGRHLRSGYAATGGKTDWGREDFREYDKGNMTIGGIIVVDFPDCKMYVEMEAIRDIQVEAGRASLADKEAAEKTRAPLLDKMSQNELDALAHMSPDEQAEFFKLLEDSVLEEAKLLADQQGSENEPSAPVEDEAKQASLAIVTDLQKAEYEGAPADRIEAEMEDEVAHATHSD